KLGYLETPTAVGRYRPNPLGLYDLHGTIWEWCHDRYDRDYYRHGPRRDPTGPDHGSERVLRGGAWFSYGKTCRTAQRHADSPGQRLTYFGFRVAMSVVAAG